MAVVQVQGPILNALSLHYADFSHASVSVKGQVGIKVDQPASGLWLQAKLLRDTPLQPYLADDSVTYERGIFQIDVCDRKGLGEVRMCEVADAVRTHYKSGTVLTDTGISVRIDGMPAIASSVDMDSYVMTPVSVPYLVEAPGQVET